MQFGMDYGLSNRDGRTVEAEVVRVLATAVQYGVSVLDTAALYGESEAVLGRTLPQGYAFRIVTKTPRFDRPAIGSEDVRELEQAFGRSLSKLGKGSVYGLLAHHADDLLADNGRLLFRKMQELKQRRLVEKIGVSVYRAEQIDEILKRYAIDLIQVPVNVLDQRLVAGGHLRKLKEAGVEVHARSVFLQGLLLMDPADLPPYFQPVRRHLADYRAAIAEQGLSPVQAAIGFVAGLKDVDIVLCGVNDHLQLDEICRSFRQLDPEIFRRFGISDERIVNPALWETGRNS